MRYINYGIGMLMVLSISACSNSPEKSRFVEYAATIPPIQVPPGIKNPTAETYYPIPPIAMTMPLGTKPPVTPPGSMLTVQRNKVQLPPPRNAK